MSYICVVLPSRRITYFFQLSFPLYLESHLSAAWKRPEPYAPFHYGAEALTLLLGHSFFQQRLNAYDILDPGVTELKECSCGTCEVYWHSYTLG